MRLDLLPSALATDAARSLDDMLGRRSPALEAGDAYFDADWTGIWTELVGGGWTALAAEPGTSIVDLALVAEAWGRHLAPLPLVETLVASRISGGAHGGALSFAINDLVPFGSHPRIGIATGAGEPPARPAELGGLRDVDDFAASLPVARLGRPGRALPPPAAAIAATLEAASAVGAASAALARSVAHGRSREQFGRPIGSFQAVRHRLADMHTALELGRSAVTWAANDPAAAGAPLIACDHALTVTEGAIQIHGGTGFTWVAPLHRYLRHAIAARSLVAGACAIIKS